MLINKDWKIESDDLCVTLYERKEKKDSETGNPSEYWKPAGYYSSIDQALKNYLQKKILRTKLISYEAVLQAIDEVKKDIENLEISKAAEEVENTIDVKVEAEK